MPPTASIPRFLLPQAGSIWRARTPNSFPTSLIIRNASLKASGKPQKPLVLEKPAKFTPPSHPQRLRKDPPRYSGPSLSAEERARQKTKKYPNMMPPEGSLMYWLVNNKMFHMWFSLSTLFCLAFTVWVTNFKRNSPFADMLPSWTQLFLHPIMFFRTFFEVLKLDGDRTTAETMERRRRKVEDVQKRAEYRKAHGLDKNEGFGGWTAKTNELAPGIPITDGAGVEELVEQTETEVKREEELMKAKKQAKKWLGIW